MRLTNALKCLSVLFALLSTNACGMLPEKHVSPIVKTVTEKVPITVPPRPWAIPKREIGSPVVVTTDRLIAWLAPVFCPKEGKCDLADKISKVLALGKMPDFDHVCWTMGQDDDMASISNDEVRWRRQALKYMDSVEKQVDKITNENEKR